MSGTPTSTTITWDADSQRLKLARGNNTWKLIYDPTAGIPAVFVAESTVSGTTTYDYYVREPGGELLGCAHFSYLCFGSFFGAEAGLSGRGGIGSDRTGRQTGMDLATVTVTDRGCDSVYQLHPLSRARVCWSRHVTFF